MFQCYINRTNENGALNYNRCLRKDGHGGADDTLIILFR